MVQKQYKHGRNYYTEQELKDYCKKRYRKNWRIKFDLIASRPPIEVYERACLWCKKTFEAKGKYERVCSHCKEKEEWGDENYYL